VAAVCCLQLLSSALLIAGNGMNEWTEWIVENQLKPANFFVNTQLK